VIAPMSRLSHFPMSWSSVESADGCAWHERDSRPVALSCARGRLTANVRCDPTRPQRLCLTTLCFWRFRQDAASAAGDERPLSPTESELEATFEQMLLAVTILGLTPELVLIESDERFEFWCEWLDREAPSFGAHRLETMSALSWALIEVVPFLEQRPFGLALAARLAERLRATGGMYYAHPYYCGHGLVAARGRYGLEMVEDGLPVERLATWPDERSFIEAVAGWSDYVCSGADPDATLFRAESAFHLNNQRITRARIEEFLAGAP
jgi:hypothetical protein